MPMSPDEFANEVRTRRLEAAQELARFLRADAEIWEALRDITRIVAQELVRQPNRVFGATPGAGGGSPSPPISGGAPGPYDLPPISGGGPGAIDDICHLIECLQKAFGDEKKLIIDLLPKLLGI